MEIEGFDRLSDKIRRCCQALSIAKCDPIGNYVGYDCSSRQVCVFQHSFRSPDWVLPDEQFAPLRVVQCTRTAHQNAGLGILTPAQQRELLQVIVRHRDVLQGPNVVLVHPSGLLSVGDQLYEVPCIRVVVWGKGKIPLGSQPLPLCLDGFPLDVLEGSPMELLGHASTVEITDKPHPSGHIHTGSRISVVAGDSSKHFGDSTFAGVVNDRHNPDMKYGLTCGHSLKSRGTIVKCNNAQVGASLRVVLPSEPGQEEDTITSVLRAVDCGLFELEGGENASFTTAIDDRLAQFWRGPMYPQPCPTLRKVSNGAEVTHAEVLYKHGTRTGLTAGEATVGLAQIVQSRLQVTATAWVRTYRSYICDCQCIVIYSATQHECFALQGDSGSLVFQTLRDDPGTAHVVGLLFAGPKDPANSGPGLACFIGDVEDKLDVNLVFDEPL